MKKKIFKVLNELGVDFNLKGRKYIEYGIELVTEDDEISATKELYPQIAKKYDTTPSRVERAIRHAVEKVFFCGNSDAIKNVFGNAINMYSGKVVNMSFMLGIAKYIKINEVN